MFKLPVTLITAFQIAVVTAGPYLATDFYNLLYYLCVCLCHTCATAHVRCHRATWGSLFYHVGPRD